MKRKVDLNEITDGKFYQLNDMVRADCQDCQGCSACCRGMGSSIVLDPYDCFRLCTGLDCRFEALLTDRLELNLVDGIVLPNLKMQGTLDCCVFLNESGRCSIHTHRPGFCRIFPLGRYYENRSFSYILQIQECPKKRSKIKVSRWIDTPELTKNQTFINDWHYFLEDLSTQLPEHPPETIRQVQQYILHLFYVTPYLTEQDFYLQFNARMAKAKTLLQ